MSNTNRTPAPGATLHQPYVTTKSGVKIGQHESLPFSAKFASPEQDPTTRQLFGESVSPAQGHNFHRQPVERHAAREEQSPFEAGDDEDEEGNLTNEDQEDQDEEEDLYDEDQEGQAGVAPRKHGHESMLAFIQNQTYGHALAVDDILVFSNGTLLKQVATDCYNQFSSKPNAMSAYLAQALKANPNLKAQRDDFLKIIRDHEAGGVALSSGIRKFVADFLVSLPPETSGFVGLCAALLGLHSERENEKPEMATASARGHCAVKWLRHYGETKRRDLTAFKEACEAGDLKGMAKGVTGSLGLKGMNP